jgi:hypothetical protein
MHVLLIEPEYYTRYPPLGLLKLAAYHRVLGDSVELIRGCSPPAHKPDLIYVTSLFTWAWKAVWSSVTYYKKLFPNVEVVLGGLYASLMPEHAKFSGADRLCIGTFGDTEQFMPAYDLVPNWDGSIIQASRGCDRKCPYCAVWRIEGKLNSVRDTIKNLVFPNHTRIVLWDNNILQSPKWRNIFEELVMFSKKKKMKIDFNQGLDARLINDEVARYISNMKIPCVRLSYDYKDMEKYVERAIEVISSYGIRKRKLGIYILFNYLDTPEDFFERVRNVLNWGAVAYSLRYQPLDALEYNKYISPNWNEERLEKFSHFRRVCGFGGAFPPYRWLLEHFNSAQNYDDAFQSPRRNGSLELRAHKDYYTTWRRNSDWRVVTEQFLSKRW